MKTNINKYKQSSSMNIGDGLFLDLFIGASVDNTESKGADNGNIINIEQGYKEGNTLQKVFSIPEGHSVFMAVRVSTMGTTYTDLLRFSASGRTLTQNFYCDNIIYFTENKPSSSFSGPVCIKSKTQEEEPTTKYTFKVLYASCGVDNITWYKNQFTNATSYARENERLTLKVEKIDEDKSTTQVVNVDSEGKVIGIDMMNYVDFIVNNNDDDPDTTEVHIDVTKFKEDIIYRFMFNEDCEVFFEDNAKVMGTSIEIESDAILSVVFQKNEFVSTDKYWVKMDYRKISTYYEKYEVDNLLDELEDDIDSKVVHKTGNETIGGNKKFTNVVNVDNGIQQGSNTLKVVSNTWQTNSPLSFANATDAGAIEANNNNATSGGKVHTALSALDATCVHKTGDETIGGVKNFTSTVKASSYESGNAKFAGGTSWIFYNTIEFNSAALSGNIETNSKKIPSCGKVYDWGNASFVHLSGNETIAGVKTFSSNIKATTGIELGNSFSMFQQTNGTMNVSGAIYGKHGHTITSTDEALTTGKSVYDWTTDYVGTEIASAVAQLTPQVFNFTNYQGETIVADTYKTKFIIGKSYGSVSVIDIRSVNVSEGKCIEIVNLNSNTYSVKWKNPTTATEYTKTMNSCGNSVCLLNYDSATGNWLFSKMAELTDIS